MQNQKLTIGSQARDFNLNHFDGKYYSLESLKENKVLLVIFSCNHCPYVQAYEQRIINLQSDYKSKGLQVVAINSNDDVNYPEDSFEDMVKRGKSKGFNFLYLRDDTQEVAKAYGISEQEVRNEMRVAIRVAMKSTDPTAQAFWKQIAPDGKETPVERVIASISLMVQENKLCS
jgi:peroxiredoxin